MLTKLLTLFRSILSLIFYHLFYLLDFFDSVKDIGRLNDPNVHRKINRQFIFPIFVFASALVLTLFGLDPAGYSWNEIDIRRDRVATHYGKNGLTLVEYSQLPVSRKK